MNPLSAFRSLSDIAHRRPAVVTIVGLGLLGEAGRVGWALQRGAAVTLFGHSGGEVWDAGREAAWVGAYVGWVGLCGVVVVGLGLAGWRARRRDRAVGLPASSTAAATARATAGPAKAPPGGAVLWRRR